MIGFTARSTSTACTPTPFAARCSRHYQHLTSLDWYPSHIVDHHVSRLHETGRYNVYVPRRWLVGQAAGQSDVSGMNLPEQFWKAPEEEARRKPARPVVVLGPDESGAEAVAAALRELGLHFGDEFVGESVRDVKLAALCDDLLDANGEIPKNRECEATVRLGDWLGNLMWQADFLGAIAAAQHPRLDRLSGIFYELCDENLDCIAVGSSCLPPRSLSIDANETTHWPDADRLVERMIEYLHLAPKPCHVAAAIAAMTGWSDDGNAAPVGSTHDRRSAV